MPDDIVKRFRRTNVSVKELMTEYRCGPDPITRLLRQYIGDAEWEILMRVRVGRKRKSGEQLRSLRKLAEAARRHDLREREPNHRRWGEVNRARRRQQRLAQKERRDRQEIEAGIAKLKGPMTSWWECIGCGCDFDVEPTGICPKCNGFRFEKIVQRCVA